MPIKLFITYLPTYLPTYLCLSVCLSLSLFLFLSLSYLSVSNARTKVTSVCGFMGRGLRRGGGGDNVFNRIKILLAMYNVQHISPAFVVPSSFSLKGCDGAVKLEV